jgi:7-cyano-7-deazaguanine synthase
MVTSHQSPVTSKKSPKRAVILLSGGLDSATTLYDAKAKGYECHCLVFDYHQRHRKEIKSALAIAKKAKCLYSLVEISLPWKGSALLDKRISLPKNQSLTRAGIPATYVPARNIIFLSFAASYAEAIGARDIFIGANAIDYSGYPDCRPDFIKSYQAMLTKGLKAGVEKKALRLQTPLIRLSKARIVKLAIKLNVPIELTWSCYSGGNKPCGVCDSCRFRNKGFQEAGY